MTTSENKILEQYFSDLYVLFTKKLATFATESADEGTDEQIKAIQLQAMLQEIIKVRRLILKNHEHVQ